MNSSNNKSESELSLKPASLDFASVKIQMTLGAIAALVISLFCFADSFKVGFLLDDFLHLDYVARAVDKGDWGDFLHNFHGNWANSPLMKSFRPLVSVSIFLDYLLWGARSWGYHLSNLLMLFAGAVLTGLISLELSGLRGNRLGAAAAIWSALLFAVYPLHLEAAIWIIGRVDLLCTLFCLISVFSYLRFRLLREKYLYFISLSSFAAALLSKEMAVTLPIVILACEFFLYPFYQEKPAGEYAAIVKTRRITAVLAFWFVLGFFATLRFIALGTTVGGYGETGFPVWKNFLSAESWQRVLFPINLDLLRRSADWDLQDKISGLLKAAYSVLLALFAFRVFLRSPSLRIIAFLLIWIFVSILPTYQIWMLSPNLVGSRLFYMSSAPFAILLAFLALPAIDLMHKRTVFYFTTIGSVSLLLIFSIWSYWLAFDIRAWTSAAQGLESVKRRLIEAASRLESRKQILILNLPSDYSGAGMLTRGQYLRMMLSPPHVQKDLASCLKVLEPLDGQLDFNYSRELGKMLASGKIAETFVWKDSSNLETGNFEPWTANLSAASARSITAGASACKYIALNKDEESNFQTLNLLQLQDLPLRDPNEWNIADPDGISFSESASGLKLRPGKKGIVLVFRSAPVSTLKASLLQIRAKTVAGKSPTLDFMWLPAANAALKDEPPVTSRAAGSSLWAGDISGEVKFSSLPLTLSKNLSEIDLGKCQTWALAGRVGLIALHLPPGSYEIEISSLELKSN